MQVTKRINVLEQSTTMIPLIESIHTSTQGPDSAAKVASTGMTLFIPIHPLSLVLMPSAAYSISELVLHHALEEDSLSIRRLSGFKGNRDMVRPYRNIPRTEHTSWFRESDVPRTISDKIHQRSLSSVLSVSRLTISTLGLTSSI